VTRTARPPTKVPSRMPEILDAAAKVFRSKGYDAASVQEIADAVGILKGSLYHYIDTKEDLLYGVVQGVLDDLLPQLDRWRSLDGTYLNRISEFLREYVEHIIRNRVKVGVFFADFESLSPSRQKVINRSKDRYDEFLREMIVNGQSEGTVSPAVDAKLATLAIYGMANATYQWYRPRGGWTPEQIASSLSDFVIRALADGQVGGR
jgi:TetR/AcrR family transcriptional regulator, cholesterol catabolism regulator